MAMCLTAIVLVIDHNALTFRQVHTAVLAANHIFSMLGCTFTNYIFFWHLLAVVLEQQIDGYEDNNYNQ